MNKVDDEIKTALDGAWHRQLAESSLERWLEISAREGWGDIHAKLPLLISVFGSSWYFTRFIFFLGREVMPLIESADSTTFDMPSLVEDLDGLDPQDEPELQLEQLRLKKNGVMLQILICYLSGQLSQKRTEQALTCLASATLLKMLEVFDLIVPSASHYRIAVLGMGRMAGYEMTFGSDLDLIFLHEDLSGDAGYELSRKIRLLLRHLAVASSAGNLYEVDMRLRPHGTSGALLTTLDSFLEHHKADREIWERQIMTRCRPVLDRDSLGKTALNEIEPYIFSMFDADYLRSEILNMRKRVEFEKGSDQGRLNVKQGRGGLMDIDFITHFLQLSHGNSTPEVRTCSTRQALEILAEEGLMPAEMSGQLLNAYDFLKQVEACIRLFDMKSISTISAKSGANWPVSIAMGYGDDVNGFMQRYRSVVDNVRGHFDEIFENPQK